jgi:multiple antibiotic resistance protein
MLRAESAPAQDPSKGDTDEKRSLTPLILFAASPGTNTGVITLAVALAKLLLPVTALAAVAVVTAVQWIAMVLMARGGTRAPGGFLRDTATQFMGLIIVAMGVQFALTGVRSCFLAPQALLNYPTPTAGRRSRTTVLAIATATHGQPP